jgi:hypothetical protein
MHLSGQFEGRDSTIRALRDLRESGLGADDIDVFSDVPLELPRSALQRRSHMSLAVVSGAILFCLLVIGFVYFTQYNYPLVTGGMPIFSLWATGVVFYELMMLGAIVTSLFWFLLESGLLRKTRQPPPPPREPGLICLRVRCHADREQVVRRLMESAGGRDFRQEGDAR